MQSHHGLSYRRFHSQRASFIRTLKEVGTITHQRLLPAQASCSLSCVLHPLHLFSSPCPSAHHSTTDRCFRRVFRGKLALVCRPHHQEVRMVHGRGVHHERGAPRARQPLGRNRKTAAWENRQPSQEPLVSMRGGGSCDCTFKALLKLTVLAALEKDPRSKQSHATRDMQRLYTKVKYGMLVFAHR